MNKTEHCERIRCFIKHYYVVVLEYRVLNRSSYHNSNKTISHIEFNYFCLASLLQPNQSLSKLQAAASKSIFFGLSFCRPVLVNPP